MCELWSSFLHVSNVKCQLYENEVVLLKSNLSVKLCRVTRDVKIAMSGFKTS